MRKIVMGALMMSGALASPAMAKTFSLAGDFGNPVFQYGTVSPTGVVTNFAQSNCNDIGVSGLCYRGSDRYQVEFQRTADSLLVHPGPGAGQNSAVLFTAPSDGVYTFDATFTRSDSGDGVDIYSFGQGGLTLVGRVDSANPTFNYAGSQFFAAGQQVGLAVDRGAGASTYFNDSTLLSGTISGAVPEPASWAMMIGGFGAVGGSLRRRRVTMRVRFA